MLLSWQFLQEKTCYVIKDLDQDCQYFLQVQAIAFYGNRRLVSDKVSQVFNSSEYKKFGKKNRDLFDKTLLS